MKKLKPGGAQIWSAAVGNNGTDYPGGMVVSADGSIYVGGRTYANGVERATLAKIDSNGSVGWTKTYGDVWGEFYDLVEVGNNIVAVGKVSLNSQNDGYVVSAAKADGTLNWSQYGKFNATYNDTFYGITAKANGFVITGQVYAGSGAGYVAWMLHLNNKGALACACEGLACDDGNGCTADVCYLGICKGSKVAQNSTCKEAGIAAGKCDVNGKCISLCGNKYCDAGENNENCAQDCVVKCGNGACEVGENTSNCSADCKGHYCDFNCGSKSTLSICYCDAQCKTANDCCNSAGTGFYGKS